MNQLTDQLKKIFLVAGIIDILAALFILGIKIWRGNSDFPIVIPILLLIPGIIMIMLAKKK